jgi:hypothetical protein
MQKGSNNKKLLRPNWGEIGSVLIWKWFF